jgi:hypothetical protein
MAISRVSWVPYSIDGSAVTYWQKLVLYTVAKEKADHDRDSGCNDYN